MVLSDGTRAGFARTMALTITALALTFSGTIPARADASTPVSVPDATLRACLTTALSDAQLSTDLTNENLVQLKRVVCSASPDEPIANLTGIEAVSDADIIFLGLTTTTDVSPLSGLLGLTQLAFTAPNLESAGPLFQVSTLTALSLAAPKVTDLDFLSTMHDLEYLALQVSPQASFERFPDLPSLSSFSLNIDTPTLPALVLPATVTSLTVRDASLTSLVSLPQAAGATSLTVSYAPELADLTGVEDLPRLRQLRLPAGKYTDLTPVSQLTALEELRAPEAAISDVSALASMTSLSTLDLHGNQLTDLTALTGLPNLTKLNVARNGLTTLGASGSLSRLTGLSASSNSLTSIDALAGAHLTSVNLDSNRLTNVAPLAAAEPGAWISIRWNALRDLSPLPDTATVNAYGQQSMHPGTATVGKPFNLGLRDVDGTPICPVFDRKVTCTNGAVNYPLSGTYQGEVSSTGSKLSLSVTQYAGPDRAFAKTYAPSLFGRPTVGLDVGSWVRSWSPKATFTYRWYRDGKAITGAAATDFYYRAGVADLGHKLSVCVIGRYDGFTPTKRCSKRSNVVRRGTLNRIPRPKVAHSKPVTVGTSLTVKPGRWDTGVRLRYQWLRNGRVIKGATKATYRVRRGDRRDLLTVRVTATKRGYNTERVIAWPHRVR